MSEASLRKHYPWIRGHPSLLRGGPVLAPQRCRSTSLIDKMCRIWLECPL